MKKTIYIFSVSTLILLLFSACKETISTKAQLNTPKGMVWVDKKTFLMGAKQGDSFAMNREKPAHYVTVDGFFIDQTEVTNKQFREFVKETNYVTIAERPIDWEELKKQLPPGTQKPHDSVLQPGSLVFNKNVNAVVNMANYSQWWTWKVGANWKHPQGPGSNIEGKDNFPVIHVAYEDALAYCKWANKRLPTEAEWESAALGNKSESIYTWGNDFENLYKSANTWQGKFPVENNPKDGFQYMSEVKSFPPNSIGIYDMIGNVWEITSDLFNVAYYQQIDSNETIINPTGAKKSFSPSNPYEIENVIKGGSYLCHQSYCASFRISARMGVARGSSSDHTGFRTVVSLEQVQKKGD